MFMLFVSGGILETYRQGRRRISVGDFFAVSGAFFWRFVRLTLFSLVPFALLREAYFEVEKASDYLGDKVSADQVGFVIWLAGVLLLVVIALFVRLWFDVAKVHTVASDDRRMLRCAWKGLAVPRRQLRALLWIYLRISLVAWLTAVVAFLIWTKIPPTAIWATFVLLELVMLVQLGARLWQMASATLWYKRHVVVPTQVAGFRNAGAVGSRLSQHRNCRCIPRPNCRRQTPNKKTGRIARPVVVFLLSSAFTPLTQTVSGLPVHQQAPPPLCPGPLPEPIPPRQDWPRS